MIYPMKAFYNTIATVYHKNAIRISSEWYLNVFGIFSEIFTAHTA